MDNDKMQELLDMIKESQNAKIERVKDSCKKTRFDRIMQPYNVVMRDTLLPQLYKTDDSETDVTHLVRDACAAITQGILSTKHDLDTIINNGVFATSAISKVPDCDQDVKWLNGIKKT